MIIEKYYVKKEEIKKMVIKSSIVNEVIRGNFKLLNFFYDKILQAQKAQKGTYKQTKLKKTSKEKVTNSLIYVLCFLC